MSSRKDTKIPLTLRIVCGVFFMSFSFVFLYCLQGDLLAYAQYVYSGGVTRYSIPVGALTITLILMIIQWCIARLQHFGTNYYALSYTVPTMLLAILTSVNIQTIRTFSLGIWIWLLPLIVLLYIIIVKLLNQYGSLCINSAPHSLAGSLWINASILLVLILSVGSIANNNDVLLYELKTERLIADGRYADAAEVGEKSLVSSRRLTELRMYALARQGELGERMFHYPQYYGTAGLLDIADTSAVYHRVDADDVCRYLGVVCGKGVKSTHHYFDIASRHLTNCNDTVHIIEKHSDRLNDYRRAYLLLAKDLDGLHKSLLSDSLSYMPQAYQEALLLYQIKDSITLANNDKTVDMSVDSITRERYIEYETMKHGLKDETERKNRLRREFGDTYWWYYEYAL